MGTDSRAVHPFAVQPDKVIYDESRHKLKPDADRMKVLAALIRARAEGEGLYSSATVHGPNVGAIVRWERSTYRLILSAFGEEEANSYKRSPANSLANFPVDRIEDERVMQVNRLAGVLRRACDKPLRADFDAQEYFDS